MAVLGSSNSENKVCCKRTNNNTDFSAKCILLNRDNNGNWEETQKIISSVHDLEVLFGDELIQVNLSNIYKLYHNSRDLEGGIMVVCSDMTDERYFLLGSLLIVLYDNEKPVDITKEDYKNMRNIVTLY